MPINGAAAISKIVKAEHEEFLKETDELFEKSLVEIDDREVIPVCEIKQKNILSLFKDYYPPEVLEHLTIENCKIANLVKSLRLMSKNIIKSSTPLTCLGPKCYSAERCPLQKACIAPIGEKCVVELMLIDQWEKEYIEDLGVDTQSKIEIDLIRDMIESDLIDFRTSNEIGKSGIFDWNAVGVTETGQPIYRKEEAVSIGIKLKFKARKDRVREDLMATRKARAKFGLAKSMDPSKFAAQLQERYNSIKEIQAIEEDNPEQMEYEKEV